MQASIKQSKRGQANGSRGNAVSVEPLENR